MGRRGHEHGIRGAVGRQLHRQSHAGSGDRPRQVDRRDIHPGAADRTARGQGRPILPPMPYPMYRQATDEDLRAVFAFLQSIPPIRNRVPQPIDPPESE